MQCVIAPRGKSFKNESVPTLMIKKIRIPFLSFNDKLIEALNNPIKLQFIVKDNYLYIGEKFPTTDKVYCFEDTRTGVIYDRDLLNSIIQMYELNPRRNLSISKKDIEFKEKKHKGELLYYAKINMCK